MLLDPRLDGPTAIRVQFGAIFVSLELSRSSWLVTSLSPGNGEKMSKHSVGAGDMAQLLGRLAELQRKVSSPPQAESWCSRRVRRPNVSLIWA
jgi:transposase